MAWSDNDGDNFNIATGVHFAGNFINNIESSTWGRFAMAAAAEGSQDPARSSDPYIYLWGTPPGKSTGGIQGIILARVLKNHNDLIDMTKYEFCIGFGTANEPIWQTFQNSYCGNAAVLVDDRVREMSVMYNVWANQWIMMYLYEPTFNIYMRQAPNPWGPWSDRICVVNGPVMHPEVSGVVYGSFLHPRFVENAGESVYFTMSKWFDYDVYLMKASFRKASTSTPTPLTPTVVPTSTSVFTITQTQTPTATYTITFTPTVTKTPTETDTPLPSSTPKVCNKGDANCDGNITPSDALFTFQIYLRMVSPTGNELCDVLCAADFVQDGNITPGDALCIFREYLRDAC